MARSYKKASGLIWTEESRGEYSACGRYYIQSEATRGEERFYYAVGLGERAEWESDSCSSKRAAQVQAEKYEALMQPHESAESTQEVGE